MLTKLGERTLWRYMEAVQKLPPPKPRAIITPDMTKFIKCACGVTKDRRDMPHRHSGLVPFCDIACRGACQKEMSQMASIVCHTCREVIGKVGPGRDPKDGFTYEAGRVYHVVNCDVCVPGMSSTDVVERILHRRNTGQSIPIITTT